jgi:hypothetical protein
MHLYPSIEHGGMQIELNNVHFLHIVKPRTEGECLGQSCRWFKGKPTAECFRLGVLPHCSPMLKEEKKRTEREAMEDEMFWLTGSPMKTTKQRARLKELAEMLKENEIDEI